MNYGLCANCHNGSYLIRTGERAGAPLPIPHGGTVGYPVENGRWQWKLTLEDLRRKRLPESWATDSSKDQFHALHQRGRLAGLVRCADCHAGERGTRDWTQSPRNECAKCHGGAASSSAATAGMANCNSCHVQHNKKNTLEEFAASLSKGSDSTGLKQYLESLNKEVGADQKRRQATAVVFKGTGAAEDIRQNRDTLGLASLTRAGAVPWYVWVALAGLIPVAGLAIMAAGAARRKSALKAKAARAESVEEARQHPHAFDDQRGAIEGRGTELSLPRGRPAALYRLSRLRRGMPRTTCWLLLTESPCPSRPISVWRIRGASWNARPTRKPAYLSTVQNRYLRARCPSATSE